LDNSSIANSFDKLNDIDDYFYKIKEKLNNRTSVAIFPAIVGINNYLNIIKRAEKILNKKCFEAPTLPPSIPGIRLNKLLEKEILKFNDINNSAHITNANLENNKCMYLTDNYGRKIYGKAFIFANGGILMGGLVVNSDGKIIEKILNSKVNQINPMTCNSNYKTLNALQMSGVIIDEDLKAKNENGIKFENVYFTGRNLSDWNPSLEFSSEGVSIASGWHSANTVASYLSI